MSLFKKMRSVFHDDWCSQCQNEMDIIHKQLFMLPHVIVGHYQSHEDANYYKQNLVKVNKKKDIPTGTYACGMHEYRCPICGHQAVKLTVFLPVRVEEKVEEVLYFDNEEMDNFRI